ncbi:hypothetical protein G6F31_019778 [Rhizopus arrhizus]|nr:hypothetical protein G6F31_019778 [Rhizopus arrhizus]
MATVPWASRARRCSWARWHWTGAARARISADLYSADDRVDGPARGVGLAPGVAIPRPPRGDTLINPDWAYVDSRDKGAMLRGELDINDNLMAYLAYGTSKTDYRYNGSSPVMPACVAASTLAALATSGPPT